MLSALALLFHQAAHAESATIPGQIHEPINLLSHHCSSAIVDLDVPWDKGTHSQRWPEQGA